MAHGVDSIRGYKSIFRFNSVLCAMSVVNIEFYTNNDNNITFYWTPATYKSGLGVLQMETPARLLKTQSRLAAFNETPAT